MEKPTRGQFSFVVSVLVTRDEEMWVTQCLEYDIAAQGSSEEEAKAAFEKTFVGQILLDVMHEKTPLDGVPRAPKEIWDKLSKAKPLPDMRRPLYLPDVVPPEVSATAIYSSMQ